LPAAHAVPSLLGGKIFVMGWEISMVNDDKNDNRFQASGRFPTIQEDEPIKWLLCSEYER
jgi:D-lyxose ketol-isomerase